MRRPVVVPFEHLLAEPRTEDVDLLLPPVEGRLAGKLACIVGRHGGRVLVVNPPTTAADLVVFGIRATVDQLSAIRHEAAVGAGEAI
jgi:hypothetical protein